MEELTAELLHSLFRYEDGKLFRKVNSRKAKAGAEAGFKSGRYMRVRVKGKQYQLHRIIFMMHKGYMPEIVDHINGDAFDNRIENLREATQSQNCMNRRLRSDNKLGIPNVYQKSPTRFAVNISVGGKNKHIGYFGNLELAELVAQEARNKYHKEFAYNG